MEFFKYSASQMADMLKKREVTSTELVSAVLKRIESTDSTLGAYLAISAEDALKNAELIDKRRASGEQLPLLAGVPISLKDNICTKGIATTAGSKMLQNFIPPYSATVANRLEESGAVLIGKLNMDEFAMGSSSETSYFKKILNPHDISRVPGGSSGGTAAAVSSGSAVVGLGSDTGGSIRQPASLCGIVGLKPTYGSVSRYGVVAFASSLDQVGPMGRTLDDVKMIHDIISGHDPKDLTTIPTSGYTSARNSMPPMNELRIGVPKEFFGEGISDEVRKSVEQAIDVYRKAGAKIVPVSIPGMEKALSAYYIIAPAEASSNLARYDGVRYGHRSERATTPEEIYTLSRSEGFGDEVKRRIMLGTFVLSSGFSGDMYNRARLLQSMLKAEFSEAFLHCDVLMTPTTPTTAFKIGEHADNPMKMYASDVCTVTVNIAGLPALSVPCGYGEGGLPIGLQIIGPMLSEGMLFDVAGHFEREIDGFTQFSALEKI